MKETDKFGTGKLSNLLIEQAIPASIGILVMSIYGIVDTIFIGRWVGSLGIGAITVVLPITFLISSIGMAIGIGGSSMIARFLGSNEDEKVQQTFGNQASITLFLAFVFVLLGVFIKEPILRLFGANGNVYFPSEQYFTIILYGVPFLAWAMMSNNVIRTIGRPRLAMFTMIIPAIANLILDPILIIYFDMGIKGAAWATTISYIFSASYTLWVFIFKQDELKFDIQKLIPNLSIIKEVFSLGSVTLARQGVISILSIVLNNSLFSLGGEMALSTYGIISRVLMFINFPVLGITQGFIPIVGYNYGAEKYIRVNDLVKLSVKYATVIAFSIFVLIFIFAPQIASIFTTDVQLVSDAVYAMRILFLATPLLAINLLGSAYFQATGRAFPSLILTLSKQGFFLIPLVLLLPLLFGLTGVWMAFPIADVGAALVTFWYLKKKEPTVKFI